MKSGVCIAHFTFYSLHCCASAKRVSATISNVVCSAAVVYLLCLASSSPCCSNSPREMNICNFIHGGN